MPERIGDFLRQCGWNTAQRARMGGDASARRYERLTRDGRTAVLMDAAGEPAGQIAGFTKIAGHLRRAGLSAPEVLAQDDAGGMALIEDLGIEDFAALIAADPTMEQPLYEAATDVISAMQSAPAPLGLLRYDPACMAAYAAPAWGWYREGGETPDATLWNRAEQAIRTALEAHAPECNVFAHRDYHAANLLWLPARTGVARVGLLDFQDAVLGHPAYDLASLLQDARRDIAPDLEDRMIARFVAAKGLEPEAFRRAYSVQAVQRHLRILGIFARLAIDRDKPGYLSLLPRVWAYLNRMLKMPHLAELRQAVLADLPPPDAAHLGRLGAV